MKTFRTTPLVIVFLLLSVLSRGQMTNLIFFTEQGERFSVVLNGILQNAGPETNIKITGLPAPSYKLKIMFEDPNIPELDKNLMFEQGTETTFNIKKSNKGEYVVRFMNSVPIAEVIPPPPTQKVILYTTSSSTITTSSSTHSSTLSNVGPAATLPPDHYVMPGYHGPIGCPYPITDLDFADVKRSIASKSFEDSKLTVAREVTSANCLFAYEVKEIMLLFDFESTRLEYAKFAYQFTYDRGNYYKVNDAFTFESSIDELREFIRP